MSEHKLDIFDVLGNIQRKRVGYYDQLSPEEQKTIQPYVLMRWLSSDQSNVVILNEVVNPYAFSLTKHKDLLWKLLIVSGSGRYARLQWNKGPSKRTTGVSTCIRVIQQAFGYSERHALDVLATLTSKQVLELAEMLGVTSDDMAKVKKELKVRSK